MRLALILCLAAAACTKAKPAPEPASACADEQFEQSLFIVCSSDGAIEMRSGKRSFAELEASLGAESTEVAFAMNAGMFDDQGAPIGLMIEDGREVHSINRRQGGGNFHLMPNGVFLIRRDGSAEVVTTGRFKPSSDIAFATQSGPMLLIGGKLHPDFDPDGTSRHVRNGVGIAPGGKPLFVISRDPVSFGKMARFLRDRHKVADALYFDGAVSSLWDPANHRMDSASDLGPLLVAFRRSAGSVPHRGARARP